MDLIELYDGEKKNGPILDRLRALRSSGFASADVVAAHMVKAWLEQDKPEQDKPEQDKLEEGKHRYELKEILKLATDAVWHETCYLCDPKNGHLYFGSVRMHQEWKSKWDKHDCASFAHQIFLGKPIHPAEFVRSILNQSSGDGNIAMFTSFCPEAAFRSTIFPMGAMCVRLDLHKQLNSIKHLYDNETWFEMALEQGRDEIASSMTVYDPSVRIGRKMLKLGRMSVLKRLDNPVAWMPNTEEAAQTLIEQCGPDPQYVHYLTMKDHCKPALLMGLLKHVKAEEPLGECKNCCMMARLSGEVAVHCRDGVILLPRALVMRCKLMSLTLTTPLSVQQVSELERHIKYRSKTLDDALAGLWLACVLGDEQLCGWKARAAVRLIKGPVEFKTEKKVVWLRPDTCDESRKFEVGWQRRLWIRSLDEPLRAWLENGMIPVPNLAEFMLNDRASDAQIVEAIPLLQYHELKSINSQVSMLQSEQVYAALEPFRRSLEHVRKLPGPQVLKMADSSDCFLDEVERRLVRFGVQSLLTSPAADDSEVSGSEVSGSDEKDVTWQDLWLLSDKLKCVERLARRFYKLALGGFDVTKGPQREFVLRLVKIHNSILKEPMLYTGDTSWMDAIPQTLITRYSWSVLCYGTQHLVSKLQNLEMIMTHQVNEYLFLDSKRHELFVERRFQTWKTYFSDSYRLRDLWRMVVHHTHLMFDMVLDYKLDTEHKLERKLEDCWLALAVVRKDADLARRLLRRMPEIPLRYLEHKPFCELMGIECLPPTKRPFDNTAEYDCLCVMVGHKKAAESS